MTSERIVIDDMIVLGRAVPEHLRNGRVTVCTAGYSKKLGFVRVFPTTAYMPFNNWNIVKMAVERDAIDTRRESWKIQGSKSEWETLGSKVEVVGQVKPENRLNMIANLIDDCVSDINDARRSLGIVKPTVHECYFASEKDFDPTIQKTLFGKFLPTTKDQYPEFPKIKYNCSKCKLSHPHNQTVLEWGFYEWMRKHPENREQVWENAKINSPTHECYFLVGNMRDKRTAYLIISVVRLQKGCVTKTLFPLSK